MSDKNLYGKIGKDISDAVAEGLKTGNFGGLNDTISSSVDSIFKDVGDRLSGAGGVNANRQTIRISGYHGGYSDGADTRARQERLQQERMERQAAAQRARERNRNNARVTGKTNALKVTDGANEIMVPFRNAESSASVITSIVGGIGLGITTLNGISCIPTWVAEGVLGGAIVSLCFAGVFGYLLYKGSGQRKRLERAKRYAQMCGPKQYIEMDYIASSTGKSTKYVVKDIKKMLSAGYFPQGHLDREEKTFIISDEVYRQYIETDRYSLQRENGHDVIDTTARDVSDDNPALTAMIDEGNRYITRLHELNDEIPGEGISFKLDRLETLLKEIFARIEVTPEQMPRMQEMMEYYLPTMIKLVEAYAEYDKISEPDEDVLSAKTDIENTLDTINGAFNKLLSLLFKDSVWDVTTDAQVLKTMLVQKGLANNMEDKE